ncbi:hypothetical protein N6H18_08075 [Reichenbachiella agarivorans]|uniref:DUF3278 domain-containing protein n=1 Tax=Reichenbachiella agarivorans TaxID=2979464 RepID=A0ABY6D079_9BACT|nr:hypothetical protein [Reichenbachiella agarivorans]UXP33900.1 hypothetical protein N6H18_08075 [Reichenbachiella agarivorans]
MEELDIKQIWKQGGKEQSFSYSDEAIERIVRQQPQNIVSRFVSVLRKERWANLIVLSALAIYLLLASYWGFAALVILMDAAFFFYYYFLIQKLDREFIDNNVVQYLKDVHQSICRFNRHFKITLVVIGAASVGFWFYLGYGKYDDVSIMMEQISWARWSMALVVTLGCIVLAFYMFGQMYGKKAKMIKSMVESLDQEETDS